FVERLIGTMRREFLDHMLFWNARDLERKLAEFQVYYNAARGHASLEGHTPRGFASGHTAVHADLNHVRWLPIAGTSSSSQSPPDNEFETDTRACHGIRLQPALLRTSPCGCTSRSIAIRVSVSSSRNFSACQ